LRRGGIYDTLEAVQNSDDAELVERALRGDLTAYGELVQRYQDQALGAAYAVLGDRQEAEDATQEAFTRAFQALNRFQPGGSFRAWLLRIVVNEAHDLRSARQRRTNILSRASGELETTAATPSAEDAALKQRRREALLGALFALPETDRLVITCRYFLDLPEAEIAEVLGVALGTVKSRLSRALARLEPILRELGPLVVVGPVLRLAAEAALQELGGGPLIQPNPTVVQAAIERLGSSSSSGSASTGFFRRIRHSTVTVAAAAAGLVAVGALLVSAAHRPVAAEPPTTSQTVPGPAVVVYGADLTDSDRQSLAAYFGSTPPAATQTISRRELDDSLGIQAASAGPADQAISSVALTCSGSGSGLEIETDNITRIPAPAYAGILLTAGLADASVEIAAPADKPVTGETALVGLFKAFPTCSGGQQADPERVRLAYEQLDATSNLAADGSDLTRASAVFLTVLHAVVTGEAQDSQAVQNALDAAANQERVPLEAATRSQLVSLFDQLRGLNYGVYARGYDILELGPQRVKVVAQST
jgi:RNA polymerase sigma factor (sigma-70 family)